MLTTALDVIITLKFCFTFSRVMHVLSLCVCYNKELTLNLFWFIRETSLSSSLCQQEQPVNKPVFARLQQRIRHIGEEMLPRGFSDTLKWTQTKILACDVSLFFFFFLFFLSGFRSAYLIQYIHLNATLLQNLNLAANQNSIFFL